MVDSGILNQIPALVVAGGTRIGQHQSDSFSQIHGASPADADNTGRHFTPALDARVPVVTEPEGTILLCVHGPDVLDLCPRWPGRTVVTFQNGVKAEAMAARWCKVIGGVWR